MAASWLKTSPTWVRSVSAPGRFCFSFVFSSLTCQSVCLRSPWRFHRRVWLANSLCQRPGGISGTSPGSLLYTQRSVGPGQPARQQLQVQRSRHPADVTVASGGVALRKQAGDVESTFFFKFHLTPTASLVSLSDGPCIHCRKWIQSPVAAVQSPTLQPN